MNIAGLNPDRVNDWSHRNAVLFHEGVLTRLEKPADYTDDPDEMVAFAPLVDIATLANVQEVLRMTISSTDSDSPMTPIQDVLIRRDLAVHLIRNDIDYPALYSASGRFPRDMLIAAQAQLLFRYLLPTIDTLDPHEILEIREKVRDTREGFTMHVQKLSRDIDAMMTDGARYQDVAIHAQQIVETELLPDYSEFKRQFSALGSGPWRKLLKPATEILAIDAAPWTLKFYGEIVRALGCSFLTSDAARAAKLTNRHQAMQFLSRLEAHATQ